MIPIEILLTADYADKTGDFFISTIRLVRS